MPHPGVSTLLVSMEEAKDDVQEAGWTVDIDVANDATRGSRADFDAHFDAFAGALAPYDGAVATNDDRTRYGARFSLTTDEINPVAVLELGLDVFHEAAFSSGMPGWQVVRCEILTFDEDDAEPGDDADSDEA